ncbi:MAG: hypothetical protein LBE09_09220 [Christensenellaceae bacterium]|jgi:hypothetical protein|nr:hypothetical protein [Christensenellaceae bacterium]
MWSYLIVGVLLGLGISSFLIFALKEPRNRERQKAVLKKIWKIELLIVAVGTILGLLSGFFFQEFLIWIIIATALCASQLFIWYNIKIARDLQKKENSEAKNNKLRCLL